LGTVGAFDGKDAVASRFDHAPYKNYRTDPDLKHNYSTKNAAAANGFYTDIAVDSMSREHPKVLYVHAAPGFVKTNWGNEWPLPLRLGVRALQLFLTSPEVCAEYMCEPLLRADSNAHGGFLLMSRKATPVQTTKLHDEAREFVWEHTKKVLSLS